MGRPQDAIRDASEAIAVDPDSFPALNARATALCQLQDPRWMQDAQTIIDQAPRTPFDRIIRGRALVSCNRAAEALAEANAALQADPENQVALAFRGSIHAAMQRFDDALRDAGAALAVNPLNPFALMVRAQASLMTGNCQQAARDAIELLRIRPDDPVAGNILDLARNPWKMNMMRMGMAARNWFQPPQVPPGQAPEGFPPPYNG
jgi:tetratricopeptide (TPR) repeat protein